jgi:hypothetical protein
MRTILCGLILLISMTVLAANKLQPLNVRIGLWEVTQTIASSGQAPIPPDALVKMTPEQRAKVEQQLKNNNRTTTRKSCLTKEKLEKDPGFSDNPNCTWTVLTSTASQVNARGECADHGIKDRVTLKAEALSPESVKGSGQGTISAGDRTMTMNLTFTAKWLGASCGNVK